MGEVCTASGGAARASIVTLSHPNITWAKCGPKNATIHGVWKEAPTTLCGRMYYPLRRQPSWTERLCVRCEIAMWAYGVRPREQEPNHAQETQLPL